MFKTAFLSDAVYLKHNEDDPWHPENAGRISSIDKLFKATRWADDDAPVLYSPRSATEEEITLNHTQSHLERVKATKDRQHAMPDPDTSTSSGSYEAALKAAGALLTLADAVMRGEIDNAFAAVRPPPDITPRRPAAWASACSTTSRFWRIISKKSIICAASQ